MKDTSTSAAALAAAAPPRPEAIRIENLHKSFGKLEVLRGVSLTAHAGDVVAIIGGSGSGKSTLLRCINFLEAPSSGRILIGGEEVTMRADGTPASRRQIEGIRRRLGMVFQQFNLWSHKTVLENLIEVPVHVLGNPAPRRWTAPASCWTAWALPTRPTSSPASCRAASNSAPPSPARWPSTRAPCCSTNPPRRWTPNWWARCWRVIRDLAAEGRTMILVTHEMKFAREVASHVVYLHQGRIEEEGPPETLFGAPRSDRLKQFLKSVA
jgi:octopine/nopaline transport system ATP-binding protein